MDYSKHIFEDLGKKETIFEVLNGDKYLKMAVLSGDLSELDRMIDEEYYVASVIVACRKFGRMQESKSDRKHIAKYCVGETQELEFDKFSISRFFCQNLCELDFNMFGVKAKKFFKNHTVHEAELTLDKLQTNLDGADFRHLITCRWDVEAVAQGF